MTLLHRTLLVLRFSMLLVAACLALPTAHANDESRAAAVAMVERALAHIEAVGTTKAFADFNTNPGPWVNGDLYVLAYGFDGENLVLGANPSITGKNLWDVKSPDGVLVVQAFVDTVVRAGSGWVKYQWSNPATHRVERKITYVTRIPGMDALIGVGIYY